MFSNQSRYRAVPDVTLPRADGRAVAAKDLRLLPDVTGTFTHTVGAGDRLDQLAFTYYGRPLDYWRICDGNPGFLSPLELLGQEPVLVTCFPATPPPGHDPPWDRLLAALSGTAGVEEVTIVDDVTLVPEPVQQESESWSGVVTERHTWAVLVTHNRFTIEADAVGKVIGEAGFKVGDPSVRGQLGRQIVIPPAIHGQVRA
ncbi:hypothetical protein ABZ318_37540 [Streptomyces sp. NPDC006197]|uniref:hypothetical protein n=1 Tax=Streptomyces sp. NPDC006197 TaxID=3156685 RepID=UPI0033BE8892